MKKQARLKKRILNRRLATILAALIVMSPSIVWAYAKRCIFAWDQAVYADTTVELWFALTHNIQAWPKLMFSAIISQRPPAIAWFGQFFVPLGQLCHSIDFGLLCSTIAVQGLTVILLLSIGQELFGNSKFRSLKLLPCAVIASSPLFIAVSTEYLVEPFQLLGTTMVYWVAVKSKKLSFWQIVSYLMMALAVVVLSKASSPLYSVFPAGYAFINAIKARRDKNPIVSVSGNTSIFVPALVLALSAVTWYLQNFKGALQVVKDASVGVSANIYAQRLPFLDKLLHWLDQTIIPWYFYHDFKWWFAGGLLIALLAGSLRAWRQQSRLLLSTHVGIAAAALAQIVVVLMVFALSTGEDIRYSLALMPSFAILLALLLFECNNKILTRCFLGLFCVQFLVVHMINFQTGGQVFSGIQLNRPFDDRRAAELDRLIKIIPPSTLNVCGISYAWLNPSTLNYTSVKQKLTTGKRCYFDHWSVARLDDIDKLAANMYANADFYFVSVEKDKQETPSDAFNKIAEPVLESVQSSNRFIRIPFQSGNGILLFKRKAAKPN